MMTMMVMMMRRRRRKMCGLMSSDVRLTYYRGWNGKSRLKEESRRHELRRR